MGTHRALLADMHDADAIEAISFEQLATIIDRLRLRRGCESKHQPGAPSRIPAAPHARGSHLHIEPTAAGRSASSSCSHMR